jgi:hypothetical protein
MITSFVASALSTVMTAGARRAAATSGEPRARFIRPERLERAFGGRQYDRAYNAGPAGLTQSNLILVNR